MNAYEWKITGAIVLLLLAILALGLLVDPGALDGEKARWLTD